MLFLLIAVAICLLVSWLPVLMVHRLRQWGPPPGSERNLQRRAGDWKRRKAGPATKEVSAEDYVTEASTLRPLPPRVVEGGLDRRREAQEQAGPSSGAGSGLRDLPKQLSPPSLSLRWSGWLNAVFVALLVGAWLGLGYFWAVLFDYLAEERARSFTPAVFLFKPFSYGLVCALPAVLLGMFSAIPLLALFTRLSLGRQRFLQYLYMVEGPSLTASPMAIITDMVRAGLLTGLACALFICMSMNWYARFTEDHIAIKRLLSLGEEAYPYSRVRAIVVASHRRGSWEIVPEENLAICFDDGRVWNTDETFFLPRDPAERARLLEFLSQKTGKPITHVRLLEEAPR